MKLKYIILLVVTTFLLSCKKDITKTTIGLQILGHVDQDLIPSVKRALSEVYNCQVVILNPIKKIPKNAFINVKSPRYRADTLLTFLHTVKPDSIDYILALTSKDISYTKRGAFGKIKEPINKYQDWGIMGLGERPGKTCIVSTFRIKLNNRQKFKERFSKVCVHEIGHNLGLKHCSKDEKCIMRDAAETVKTIDKIDLALCDRCKNKIN